MRIESLAQSVEINSKLLETLNLEGENLICIAGRPGMGKTSLALHMVNKQSIVVFLRKIKNEPYVTIEFDYETFDIIQARGKYNRQIDSELHKYIADLGKRLNCERLSHE